MSVFKRTHRGQKGGKIIANKYSIEFRDHTGRVRRVGAFKDKKASEELERGMLRLTALRASGATPDAEAARFLESVPGTIRDNLAAWGIVDSARAAGGRSLDSLIDARFPSCRTGYREHKGNRNGRRNR